MRLARDEVLLVHAGTAASDRLRGETNAWNRLTLRDHGIGIEVRRLTAEGWRTVEDIALSWPGDPAEGPG